MGKTSSANFTEHEYYQSVAVMVCCGPIKRLRRIWFDAEVVYDDRPEVSGWAGRPQTSDGRRPSLASWLVSSNIEVHLGSQTQGRSPTVEAMVGTADCPAYRGRAYVVFKDLPMHKTMGRIPQMSFEVESADADADGKADLADVVAAIIELAGSADDGLAGIPSGRLDLSALEGITVDGLMLASRNEARQHLAGLQDSYQFDFIEIDGTFMAVIRGGESTGSIELSDCGAGMPQGLEDPYTIKRAQAIEVPQRVDVVYHSAASDFQNFTQSTSQEASLLRSAQVMNLPVVMSENNAMAIARQTLARVQLRRESIRVSVMPWHMAKAPGDVVTFKGRDWVIDRKLEAVFGPIELDLVPEDADIYTLTGEGAAPPGTGGSMVVEDYRAILWAADLPALVNQSDASFDGCSIIAVAATKQLGWKGGTMQAEAGIKDISGQRKTVLTTHNVAGTIGYLQSTLPAWEGGNRWDTTSELVMRLAGVFAGQGAPGMSNVGDGIIEMANPSTTSGVVAGAYIVLFTGTESFVVKDPSNVTVGTGSTGDQFADEVIFTITSGGTAFQSGDTFTITVAEVGVINGTPPEGSTDLEVLNGANVAVVNGEVLQFVAVEDLGNDTYRLTRLLRGRRGTEPKAWAAHAAGSTVALLTDGTAQRFKAHLTESGSTKEVAMIESDVAGDFFGNGFLWAPGSFSGALTQSLTLEGNARKPWGPGKLRADDSGADCLLSWVYRSRWGTELENGTGTVPLGEDTEGYELEVWDPAFTTLKRTVTGLTAPSYTYADASRVTDFGSSSASFGFVVYQTSRQVGRGFPARMVVP